MAQPMEQQVWNEQAIIELLCVNRNQLDRLRYEKDFPGVHLRQRTRVYQANEGLDFPKSLLVQDKWDLGYSKPFHLSQV